MCDFRCNRNAAIDGTADRNLVGIVDAVIYYIASIINNNIGRSIIDDVDARITDIVASIINGIPVSFVASMVTGMIYDGSSGASVSYRSSLVSTLMAISPPGPLCGGPLPELRLQRGAASHRLL